MDMSCGGCRSADEDGEVAGGAVGGPGIGLTELCVVGLLPQIVGEPGLSAASAGALVPLYAVAAAGVCDRGDVRWADSLNGGRHPARSQAESRWRWRRIGTRSGSRSPGADGDEVEGQESTVSCL